jgi:hypothetical protein
MAAERTVCVCGDPACPLWYYDGCTHEGQLVEVPELREVRCEHCGAMAPTVEKHLAEPDPRQHDDEEFTFRATELAALVAWTRGNLDRPGFRRWLRSERWPEDDLDVLTAVIEHVFATDARMPRRG